MKWAALTLSILFAGCAHVETGRRFDLNAASQVVESKTTKAEVLKLLGAPWIRSIKEGVESWTYLHSESTATVTPATVLFAPVYTDVRTQGETSMLVLTFTGDVVSKTELSVPGSTLLPNEPAGPSKQIGPPVLGGSKSPAWQAE